MIPFSGRIIRQCNHLSKSRMKFITDIVVNQKTENTILPSFANLSMKDSNNGVDDAHSLEFTQSDSSNNSNIQSLTEQQIDQQYRNPSYIEEYYTEQYPQYPQNMEYIQPYLQTYPNQYQYPRFYSQYAGPSNTTTILTNKDIQLPPQSNSAIPIIKPADYIAPMEEEPKETITKIKKDEPFTPVILDEKLRLKQERERLMELRRESNARFKLYLERLLVLDYPSQYKVECITNMDDANTKLKQLLEEDRDRRFGLDLEWPPCFIKGNSENKVSLVQICSKNRILLIQLSRMHGIPSELNRFLQSREFLKSGVNIHADGVKLYRDFGIVTNGLVELRDLAELGNSPKLMISHLRSLRALTGIFLNRNMSKGSVRVSNWGRYELTPLQIQYAALDAYASYEIFIRLEKILGLGKPFAIKHLADEELAKYNKPPKKKKVDHSKETPSKKASSKETSAKEVSSKEAPAKEAPAKEAPAKKAPAKEAPTKEAPAKEAPANEEPLKEASSKESPKSPSSKHELNNRSTPTSTVTVIKRKLSK